MTSKRQIQSPMSVLVHTDCRGKRSYIHWNNSVEGLLIGNPNNVKYWFEIEELNPATKAYNLYICDNENRDLIRTDVEVWDCFQSAAGIYRAGLEYAQRMVYEACRQTLEFYNNLKVKYKTTLPH